jgi:purine-nucleoside phosphorylase
MTDFAAFARACAEARPEAILVLGSGLGALVERVTPIAAIPFAAIPGLPSSSVAGHRGRWTLGQWGGRALLVSEGRLHYYEGHPWELVVRPVQVAAALGVRVALLTNAAGGIRDDLEPGTLMPIGDHLEWNRPYPWRQPRQPSPYSSRLLGLFREAGANVPPGVYAAVTGPSYETPAEIRALRSAGSDAVGMSTSREVLAGVAAGLECGAVSMITNRAAGLSPARLDHQEVIDVGKSAASRLADLLEAVVRSL